MRADDIAWALAAAVPLGVAGLIAGTILERAGGSAKARERIWSFVFWLGPAACALALAIGALPRRATAEIIVILRSTPLGAASHAPHVLAQAPHLHAPPLAELLLSHLPRMPAVLLGVVALGAALRLAQLGRAWLGLRALRRDAVAAPAELASVARAAGLKPGAPVRLSAEASSPVVAGLFSPVVLLPERFAASEATALVALICRHEAQHVRRRDNLRLLFEQLAAALFWFDPLRGVLHRSVLAAREERCDAAALVGCGPAERRLYARTLLDELTQPPSPTLAVGLVGAGRSRAMTRISSIIDPQPERRRLALALALCGALGCAGGGAAYAANQAAGPVPNQPSGSVLTAAKTRPAVSPPAVLASSEGDARASAIAEGAANAPAGMVVRNILVLNNSSVPVSTILSHLPISRGQTVTAATLKAAMKALSDTGLFDDVGMTLAAGDLRVRVAEKRDICRVDILDPPKKVLAAVPRGPCDELHQRIVRLAQARGVEVGPTNTLPLTVEAARSLAEERRETRPAESSAAPVAPAANDADVPGPINITADRAERYDAERMARYSGNVEIVAVGGLKRAPKSGSVFIDGQPAPADFFPSRIVADTVEFRLEPPPRGGIESVNIIGLRSAE